MPGNLDVRLQPSRYLSILLISITVLACACVLWSRLPVLLTLAIVVAAVVLCAAALRRHCLLSAPDSIRGIAYRGEHWYLQFGEQQLAATLLPTSTVTDSLLVLNFRLQIGGNMANLILLPDAAAADSLRRLKAMLRFSTARRSSFPAAE